MRIFITNYSGHPKLNLDDFSRNVLNITEGSVNVFDITRLEFDIKKFLEDNNFCKDDAVLLSGNVTLNFIAGKVIEKLGINKYKIIIYNPKRQEYVRAGAR